MLACAGCGSSQDVEPVSKDSGAVTESATGAAGRKAPAASENKPAEGKAGSGAAQPGEPAKAGAPAADSGEPVQRASEFDAGKDANRNKVTAAQLCERLATINCAGEAYCCDMPGRTVDACKQDLIKTCSSELMLDRIAMQEIARFDGEAAERAYNELERRASKCDPSVAQWGGSTEGLRGILKGSVEPKGSCKPTAALPEPVEVGAALVSCAQPETNACVYSNILDAWTCQPRAGMGGPCVTDNNCTDGLYCIVETPGLAGACQPRKASGESCQAPTECASLFCKKSKCVDADQQAAYCLVN